MGVPKQKMYSEFWSNREYVYVTEGKRLNNSIPSVVRKKLLRVAIGFKEICNPNAVDDNILAEIIDGIAHILDLKGYQDYASYMKSVAVELRKEALEKIARE